MIFVQNVFLSRFKEQYTDIGVVLVALQQTGRAKKVRSVK